MGIDVQLTIQLLVSALIVIAVIFFMWKLPRREGAFYGWGAPLALVSAWLGLIAVIGSICLWFVSSPDHWVVVLFLGFDPASIGAGVLVLWIFRGAGEGKTFDGAPIELQRVQAKTGIMLGLIAVVLGYTFVMTSKSPDIVPF